MTTYLLLLLVAASPPQAGGQPEAERLFGLGTELHAEGDALGAIAAYQAALETGWERTQLHVNLSEAYLAMGDVGRARLHAERAVRLGPRDPPALAVLEATRTAAGEPPERVRNVVQAGVRWAQKHVGAVALTAVALMGWIALMALSGWRLWTRRSSSWVRRAAVILAPLVAMLAVLAVLVGHEEARPRAVVVAPEVVVRARPSTDAPTLATLPAGRLVALVRGEELWRAVRLPDGAVGWAEAAALEEV